MKKLSLKLDDLTVDTFDLDRTTDARGTVLGRLGPYPQTLAVNDACSAGCTDYCETNGDGSGYTCDIRCYTNNDPGCLSADGPSCVTSTC